MDFLTVAPAPTPGAHPALVAFLRGTSRRALLFAALQAGEGALVDAALARVLGRFAANAERAPMARWPSFFWRLLLAELPAPDAGASRVAASPGLEALPPPGTGLRTALLLALVAGLDEEDGRAALDVDAATWRLALRRAAPRDANGDFDEAAWRVMAMAAREAQRALPEDRLAWWDRACGSALSGDVVAGAHPGAAAGTDAPMRSRGVLRLLQASVGICALALVATFLPWRQGAEAPRSENGPPVAVAATALGDAEPPLARYDTDFALRHHPDLAILLADEDALLRDLGFSAWYAARSDATTGAARAPGEAASGESANGLLSAPEPALAAPAFETPAPARVDALRRRAAEWDALAGAQRGALRERFQAWQRLPGGERAAIRAAAVAIAALDPSRRDALRAEFSAQALDLQRGWLLGPTLGARWPRLQPLLMQVPAAEREPLLARLHAMDAAGLDALALQSQRTPPQSRDALRRRLLAENVPGITESGADTRDIGEAAAQNR